MNVARGPVVDAAALHAALLAESISCYASDVWWAYPRNYAEAASCPPWLDAACDLSKLPRERCVLSPHRGGAAGTEETESRRVDALATALKAAAEHGVQSGLPTFPIGRVDLSAGY